MPHSTDTLRDVPAPDAFLLGDIARCFIVRRVPGGRLERKRLITAEVRTRSVVALAHAREDASA